MLKRLFLSKSKEILNQVESAETILKSAEKQIDKLKYGNKFHLLRAEIINLIQNSNMFYMQINNGCSYAKNGIEISKTYQQINECLDEMEKLSTTEKELQNERETSQKA